MTWSIIDKKLTNLKQLNTLLFLLSLGCLRSPKLFQQFHLFLNHKFFGLFWSKLEVAQNNLIYYWYKFDEFNIISNYVIITIASHSYLSLYEFLFVLLSFLFATFAVFLSGLSTLSISFMACLLFMFYQLYLCFPWLTLFRFFWVCSIYVLYKLLYLYLLWLFYYLYLIYFVCIFYTYVFIYIYPCFFLIVLVLLIYLFIFIL